MKRAVKCGKNGRDRVTVKFENAQDTVILTSNSVIWPERINAYIVSGLRAKIFGIVASNTVNPAMEVTEMLENEGYTVLNPCDTQFFTF